MSNFLRYGWPRWWLIRIPDWMLGEWATERLNDFLYPSDMEVRIDPCANICATERISDGR